MVAAAEKLPCGVFEGATEKDAGSVVKRECYGFGTVRRDSPDSLEVFYTSYMLCDAIRFSKEGCPEDLPPDEYPGYIREVNKD